MVPKLLTPMEYSVVLEFDTKDLSKTQDITILATGFVKSADAASVIAHNYQHMNEIGVKICQRHGFEDFVVKIVVNSELLKSRLF